MIFLIFSIFLYFRYHDIFQPCARRLLHDRMIISFDGDNAAVKSRSYILLNATKWQRNRV